MRRVIFTIVATLLFIACLAIGVRAGESTPIPFFTHPTATFLPTPNLPNQRITLFILVDDLAQANPKLVNIWLFFTSMDQMHINMVLLFPAGSKGNHDLANNLEKKFALSPSKAPSSEFLSAITGLGIKSNGYVLTDMNGLANVIDWLGGLELDNGIMDGATVTHNIPPLENNTDLFIDSIQLISDSVCQKVGHLSPDSNWISMFMKMVPDHLITDFEFAQILQDWKTYTESPTHLTCEVTIP